MGNCKSRCGRDGEVIEPMQRSTSWSGGHQTGQKATKFGETTIEDRPINEQVVIYNENEINDRIARLETLKVERRAWIKDEYLRIFGDGLDDNFPTPARPSTSLPPMRPPAPSTGITSSYNVPSAKQFTEPDKNFIENKIFEEFQSPRPSGADDYPPDPVRPASPVAGMEPTTNSNVENSLHGIQRDNPWDNNFQPKQSSSKPAIESQPVMPARTYKTPEIDPFKVDW